MTENAIAGARRRAAPKPAVWLCIASAAFAVLFALLSMLLGTNRFLWFFLRLICCCTFAYGALACWIDSGKAVKAAKAIRAVLTAGVALFVVGLLVSLTLVITGSSSDKLDGVEYAVVLGAGLNGDQPSPALKSRLDAALDCANENEDIVFVLCGGKGAGEAITECDAMYNYLSSAGVAPERLLKEEESRDTAENLANAAKIIEDRTGKENNKAAIITNSFHMYRSKLLANRSGLEPYAVSAATPASCLHMYVREYFSLIIYCIELTGITVDTSNLNL